MKNYCKPTINTVKLDSVINLHGFSEHPGNGNHNGHNNGNHNGHNNPNNPWSSDTFVESPFKQSPFK